jgi:hypothetical protein
VEDDPKYAWNRTPLGKDFRISIQRADGEFVPIRAVRPSARPYRIVCEPIPGPNGTINYVQDWVDLTHFG